MSKKTDILEAHDQRNDDQLHQRHRHAVRAAKKQKPTTSHHLLHSTTERSRSTARSWKRHQLTAFENDDLDGSYDETDTNTDTMGSYSDRRIARHQQSLYTIAYAINSDDPDFLSVLLRELKTNNNNKNKKRNDHTILTHAIVRGNSECIRIVLERIFRGSIYPTIIDHVCSNGSTALWYACKKGDLELVRELVECGHANTNKCGSLIVAAQDGHVKIVEYLLHKGCDPNRHVKNYNERALHAASRRNHLAIVNLLLKYGADTTVFDYKQRTALDYAIHKKHNELAKVLIEHQRGHFLMSGTGFTPLMLAVHCGNACITDVLFRILPRQQTLDELALLASRYTIDGPVNKRDQAYCYFEKALSAPTLSHNNKPCEAYEFLSECQTRDELALIRDNDNAMRMHALLFSERLLLKSNNADYLIALITRQSNIYRWSESFHRCLQLRLHAYRLINQIKLKKWNNSRFHKKKLFALVSILFKILQKEGSVPVESLALIWTWIFNRKDKELSDLLFKLLFIITYHIDSKKLTGNEHRIVSSLIRRALHQNITMMNGYFLFSFCVDQIRHGAKDYTFDTITVSLLSIVRLLIQYGANVSEVNLISNATPLHLIARCEDVNTARFVMRLLLDTNAHTDCVDTTGRQPKDLAGSLELREFLHVNQRLSLKCLCAHRIIREDVCYTTCLSSKLIGFVQMHTKNEINYKDRSLRLALANYSYNIYLPLTEVQLIIKNDN